MREPKREGGRRSQRTRTHNIVRTAFLCIRRLRSRVPTINEILMGLFRSTVRSSRIIVFALLSVRVYK